MEKGLNVISPHIMAATIRIEPSIRLKSLTPELMITNTDKTKPAIAPLEAAINIVDTVQIIPPIQRNLYFFTGPFLT